MTIAPPSSVGTGQAALTDEELQNYVASPLAGCAGTALDPDEWYPIAAKADGPAPRQPGHWPCARRARCGPSAWNCRYGPGVVPASVGIWGGLVEADRNSLRREWLRGAPVTALLARLARAS